MEPCLSQALRTFNTKALCLDLYKHSLVSLSATAWPCSELTDEDVRTAIKNSGGVKGSLLIPEAPFELLVRRAISRLLPSALQCQQFVHAELLRIASQCAPTDVSRFPNLQVSRGLIRPSMAIVGCVKECIYTCIYILFPLVWHTICMSSRNICWRLSTVQSHLFRQHSCKQPVPHC